MLTRAPARVSATARRGVQESRLNRRRRLRWLRRDARQFGFAEHRGRAGRERSFRRSGQVAARELYDHAEDPDETVNRAEEPGLVVLPQDNLARLLRIVSTASISQ